MKRVTLSMVLAAGLASSSAMAADMATKAPPAAPAPAVSPWDVAITAALMTDYNFRGITQSAHNPSTQAGFELRYTQSPTLQYYAGISGESIDFPNHAAAEIDYYGGFRPTFDKLALDFGFWYYDYPGGVCNFNNPGNVGQFNSKCGPALVNGNVSKQTASFYEWYGKATYTLNDQWAFGLQEWYSPSVSNTGSVGWFTTGNATYTAPSTWFASGWGGYASADLGYWALGKSDAFYGVGAGLATLALESAGDPYKSFWTWDAGFGVTYKAFTLDLRYYDTNLNKGDCNAFTSDQTAGGVGHITAANPGGVGSNWCGSAYIAKLSFATNLSSIK